MALTFGDESFDTSILVESHKPISAVRSQKIAFDLKYDSLRWLKKIMKNVDRVSVFKTWSPRGSKLHFFSPISLAAGWSFSVLPQRNSPHSFKISCQYWLYTFHVYFTARSSNKIITRADNYQRARAFQVTNKEPVKSQCRWWLLRRTITILTNLRLMVYVFPLLSPEILLRITFFKT